MKISAISASKALVAMNEAQNQRRALLVEKKSIPKPMEEIQPNVIKKIAWKSRRVNWLRILWPFQYIFLLLEGTKLKVSWLKTILSWIGCLIWMRRYAGKKGENQQESYAKFMKRKTKGMFFYTRIVEVVLKKSKYEWNGLYLYSSKKNQRWFLPSVNWVSIARTSTCRKSSIPILIEEAQLKVIKKTELGIREESNHYAYFGLFSLSRFC